MLIDGTVNVYVTRIVMLPIEFACGYSCMLKFYVTKLNSVSPVVLGFSWLIHCNLVINWIEGTITIWMPTTERKVIHTSSKAQLSVPSTQTLPTPEVPSLCSTSINQTGPQAKKKPTISFINVTAF